MQRSLRPVGPRASLQEHHWVQLRLLNHFGAALASALPLHIEKASQCAYGTAIPRRTGVESIDRASFGLRCTMNCHYAPPIFTRSPGRQRSVSQGLWAEPFGRNETAENSTV
jgi:hypothetical protein